MIVYGLLALLFPEQDPVKEVDGGPHGAEPAAEKIPQDDDQKKNPEGGEHPPDQLFLGNQRDDPDERRQAQVKIHRDPDLQRKGGLENQIEKKQKGNGLDENPQTSPRKLHAALDLFHPHFGQVDLAQPQIVGIFDEADLSRLVRISGFRVFEERGAVGIHGDDVLGDDDLVRILGFSRALRPVGGQNADGVDDHQIGFPQGVEIGDALVQIDLVQQLHVPDGAHQVLEAQGQLGGKMLFGDGEIDENIGFEHILVDFRRFERLCLGDLHRLVHIAAVPGEDLSPGVLGCFLQFRAGKAELVVVAGVIPDRHPFGAGLVAQFDQGVEKLGIVGAGLIRRSGPGDVGFDHHPLPFFHDPAHSAKTVHGRLQKLGGVPFFRDDQIGFAGPEGLRRAEPGIRGKKVGRGQGRGGSPDEVSSGELRFGKIFHKFPFFL